MLTVTEQAQDAFKDYFAKQNVNSPIRIFLKSGWVIGAFIGLGSG